MLFTPEQIKELLQIVDYHASFATLQTLGKDSLDSYDKFILIQNGIDPDKFTDEDSPYYQNYMWGRLSAMLADKDAEKVNFEDFKQYIQRGQYIPLNKQEKIQYEITRNNTYEHLKDFWGKRRTDINTTIGQEELKRREQFEKIIGDNITEGVLKRKSVQGIVSNIGHQMNRWDKDYGRIVETEMQNIFNRGRAVSIKNKGKEVLVFKETYPGACRHCIRLHLTSGIGSQPILFTISQLEANGTNYGKKQEDWKATVDAEHPFCRCHLRALPENYTWDEEEGRFTPKINEEPKIERKSKVRIKIGDKEFSS